LLLCQQPPIDHLQGGLLQYIRKTATTYFLTIKTNCQTLVLQLVKGWKVELGVRWEVRWEVEWEVAWDVAWDVA
jgi:hypothetical protein